MALLIEFTFGFGDVEVANEALCDDVLGVVTGGWSVVLFGPLTGFADVPVVVGADLDPIGVVVDDDEVPVAVDDELPVAVDDVDGGEGEPVGDVDPDDELEEAVLVDEDVDDDEELDDDEEVDDEFEPDGTADATPGMVATADPTPSAIANAPTRPTYLALPIMAPCGRGCPAPKTLRRQWIGKGRNVGILRGAKTTRVVAEQVHAALHIVEAPCAGQV